MTFDARLVLPALILFGLLLAAALWWGPPLVARRRIDTDDAWLAALRRVGGRRRE